jgi:hypothetical protein
MNFESVHFSKKSLLKNFIFDFLEIFCLIWRRAALNVKMLQSLSKGIYKSIFLNINFHEWYILHST